MLLIKRLLIMDNYIHDNCIHQRANSLCPNLLRCDLANSFLSCELTTDGTPIFHPLTPFILTKPTQQLPEKLQLWNFRVAAGPLAVLLRCKGHCALLGLWQVEAYAWHLHWKILFLKERLILTFPDPLLILRRITFTHRKIRVNSQPSHCFLFLIVTVLGRIDNIQ